MQESYTLVFAATLLIWGALADRIGRRRMLLIGVVVFVVASGLAAVATSGEALIGARIIQGFGGAMILPTTLSLINVGFTGPRPRHRLRRLGLDDRRHGRRSARCSAAG